MIYLGGVLAEVNNDHLILMGRDDSFTIRLSEKQVQSKIASKFAKLEGREISIAVWFAPDFSKCMLVDAKPRELGNFIEI